MDKKLLYSRFKFSRKIKKILNKKYILNKKHRTHNKNIYKPSNNYKMKYKLLVESILKVKKRWILY